MFTVLAQSLSTALQHKSTPVHHRILHRFFPCISHSVTLEVRHECRSVNRNCCLGIWNLYFVFQFPNCRARRVIWILHGDIWILKSVQVPKSAARRGIWNLDDQSRFLETAAGQRTHPSSLDFTLEQVFSVSVLLGFIFSSTTPHSTWPRRAEPCLRLHCEIRRVFGRPKFLFYDMQFVSKVKSPSVSDLGQRG
jgi:hypothetical protein